MVYVDDDVEVRQRYARRLRGPKLVVQTSSPPAQLDVSPLASRKPDLFLVDYELTKARTRSERVSYLGGALATAIRERFPEHPIVLMTRRNLVSQPGYQQIKDVGSVFDETLYKGDIDQDPAKARYLLASLATGFRKLRRKRVRTWKSLVHSLDADDEEAGVLRKAAPPLYESAGSTRGSWRVVDAARWIREVVLNYPGVLYDRLHAATALGIASESFSTPRLQRIFSLARYCGVFATSDGHWWRGRLLRIAQDIIGGAGLSGATGSEFKKAFEKRYGSPRLAPAVCVHSKTAPADWVCYVLKQPVKREYSLSYYPDSRPPVMDEARVSFKAIREDNRVIDEHFSREMRGLLEKIRSSQR